MGALGRTTFALHYFAPPNDPPGMMHTTHTPLLYLRQRVHLEQCSSLVFGHSSHGPPCTCTFLLLLRTVVVFVVEDLWRRSLRARANVVCGVLGASPRVFFRYIYREPICDTATSPCNCHTTLQRYAWLLLYRTAKRWAERVVLVICSSFTPSARYNTVVG